VSKPGHRTVWVVVIAVCALVALHAANLFRLPMWPCVDLPNHLAEARVIRETRLQSPSFVHVYDVRMTLLRPGTLHAWVCSLFADVEKGNAILYGAYLLLLPASVLVLCRLCNVSACATPFSLLLIQNFSFVWGFSGYTLAIPVVLLAMACVVQTLNRPSGRWSVALAAGLVLLFYLHVLALVFAVVAIAGICLVEYMRRRKVNWTLAGSLVPAGLLVLLWVATGEEVRGGEEELLSYLRRYYVHEYFPSLAGRWGDLFWRDVSGVAYGGWGQSAGLLLCGTFIVPGLLGLALSSRRMEVLWEHDGRRVVVIVLALALLCFALLPDQIPGQPFLHARYSVFVHLSAVVLLGLTRARWTKALLLFSLCAACAHLVLWWQYGNSLKRETRGLSEVVLPNIRPERGPVAAIFDEARFRGQPIFFHAQNYALVRGGSIVVSRMTDYRFSFIRRGDEGRKLPIYQELVEDKELAVQLVGRYAGCGYLITRGRFGYDAAVADSRCRRIAGSGKWNLFEYTSPQEVVAGAEEKVPTGKEGR
jgi:hypothetical protein